MGGQVDGEAQDKGDRLIVMHRKKGQVDRGAQDKETGCQQNNGRVNCLQGIEE